MSSFKQFLLGANLIAWILCARLLYPLPSFDTEGAAADSVLWIVYVLMISIGMASTLILNRARSHLALVLLSISTGLYLVVRTFHFDWPIYALITEKAFDFNDGSALTWGLIFTGGKGFWGGAMTTIYAFFVPLTLIASWCANLMLAFHTVKK